MKKIFAIVVVITTFAFSSPAQNTWTQLSDFGGGTRDDAVGFSIGTKGYIGTGYKVGGAGLQNDFWEYDPATNAWTQRANFGGTPRIGAVGFSIGTKGYIGTGSASGLTWTKDFWEYDPALNTWTQKADFGGLARTSAVGFSIGDKGYIGTGFFNDFWQYDPVVDTWTQIANLTDGLRWSAVGFAIGNKGYVGTGSNYYTKLSDFWEYSPETNEWIRKTDFPGKLRDEAIGFSIGNKGYVGTGFISSAPNATRDFWQYDPLTNTWNPLANLSGVVRSYAVGFSIGEKGYIGTGDNNSYQLSDFWEYTPSNAFCIVPTSIYTSDITATSAKLNWTNNGNPDHFSISYKTNSGERKKKKVLGSTSSLIISDLLPESKYVWQIKAICKDGLQSSIAVAPSFKTPALKERENPESENSGLNIYPNPSNGSFTINLKNIKPTSSLVTIQILNAIGQQVYIEDIPINNDEFTTEINLTPKISGSIYYIKVLVNSSTFCAPIILNN